MTVAMREARRSGACRGATPRGRVHRAGSEDFQPSTHELVGEVSWKKPAGPTLGHADAVKAAGIGD
jgi:hypothetical protein